MIRTIKYTKQFKRDFKREKKSGKHKSSIENMLNPVLKLLSEDKQLPSHYYDHPLNGDWKDHRDCHIKPDLVLIYRKPDAHTLELVRMGSHSELGLT